VIVILVRGPFARFQPFSAGTYRATMKFMPHSAAYGLVLHLAGIESRLDDPRYPETQVRPDLPSARIAVGAVGRFPSVEVGVQQIHNYPVGSAGSDHAADCYGQKYGIQFVKREFLAGLNVAIALEAGTELMDRVREGVLGGTGRPGDQRGVVFLGDRDFEASHVSISGDVPEAYWYEPVARDERIGDVQHSTYLTVRIDRADSSKTVSRLFRPVSQPTSVIPAEAWQDCVQAPVEGR
jgi:CRISPR-associated protein Cas5t